MLNLPGRHCKHRVFEWMASCAMLGMAALLIAWPRAIDGSKFQFILDVVGHSTFMLVCLLVGWFRVLALYLNGSWPLWGSVVRSVGAIGGVVIWTQMGLSLVISQWASYSLPPPSLPIYVSLVGAELFSAYRAAADARYR